VGLEIILAKEKPRKRKVGEEMGIEVGWRV